MITGSVLNFSIERPAQQNNKYHLLVGETRAERTGYRFTHFLVLYFPFTNEIFSMKVVVESSLVEDTIIILKNYYFRSKLTTFLQKWRRKRMNIYGTEWT